MINKLKYASNKKMTVFLLLILIMLLGVSLASIYYMYHARSEENKIVSSLVSVNFSETSNVINLTNAVPVIDDVGIENTAYTFSVTNTSNMSVSSTIRVKLDDTLNTIDERAVRYAFYINNQLMVKDNIPSNLVLYTYGNQTANETINCKVVFWVDYYYEESNKDFVAKIEVDAKNKDLINPHIITLNANGGTVSPTSIEIAEGTVYGNLPIPTKSGFVFAGWYKESTFNTRIENDSIFNDATNITLYAKWE